MSALLCGASTFCFSDSGKLGSLPDDAQLVVIDGHGVTKRDFDRHVGFMLELYKNRYPKAEAKDLYVMRLRMLSGAWREVYHRKLLKVYLGASNQVASAELRQRFERKWARSFCAKRQKFSQLREKMAQLGYGEQFDGAFEDDLRIECLVQRNYSNELAVTKDDMRLARENVERYNRIASATNFLAYSAASNVLQRLREGADFGKMADLYSQEADKEPGGVVSEDQDENVLLTFGEEFARTVLALKDGEFSGIVKTDDGLEIVKRLYSVVDTNDTSSVESIRIAHIYFRLPYVFPEQDDDELEFDLKTEKRRTLTARLFREAQEKCRIDYPNGKDFIPESKAKSKKGGSR